MSISPYRDSLRLVPIQVVNRRYREQQIATCRAKQRFDNAGDAHRSAREQAKRKSGPKLHVYHCRNCAGWHLTSKKRVGRELDKP